MGAGKTTLGRQLAANFRLRFFDLDEEIERREKTKIQAIFHRFGEGYFRELEHRYCKELSECENVVVAVGGGTFGNEANVLLFAKAFDIIFLDVDFETCYFRINGDTNRPLVMSHTKEQLKELFERRRKVYLKVSNIVL
jgi:shikimate kinase